MKVFLTGGTGFIGQPLTQSLLDRGWDVTALVRTPNSSQARALKKMGALCVTGDVTDRESMRQGMAGVDMVIHNAAWYEIGMAKSAHERMAAINVGGTDNVLGLAEELGIPRVVHVSSCVYFGDTGPEVRDETFRRQAPYVMYYEQSKTEAHELALQYLERGLPLIIVCPAHVIGPNDHSTFGYFMRMYVNHLLAPVLTAPEIIFAPAHVNDIAEGIVLASEKGQIGETYILAGESMTAREIFDLWNTRPGGFKVQGYMPRPLASLLFAPLEPLQRWMGLPAFISRETVSACSVSYNFSSAKAQRELGWRFRPAEEVWLTTMDQEIELLAARRKRDLVSRLKPLEVDA